MLHEEYNRKGSVARKIYDLELLWAWCQDEMIGGKPQVVK
jgi:hypothetical protein